MSFEWYIRGELDIMNLSKTPATCWEGSGNKFSLFTGLIHSIRRGFDLSSELRYYAFATFFFFLPHI